MPVNTCNNKMSLIQVVKTEGKAEDSNRLNSTPTISLSNKHTHIDLHVDKKNPTEKTFSSNSYKKKKKEKKRNNNALCVVIWNLFYYERKIIFSSQV